MQRIIEDAAPCGVSIIIPAYNEGRIIGEVIRCVRKASRLPDLDIEIIVVDDGSSDNTARLASEAEARVISHGANRGYGESIKTGMRAAAHGLILILDADGTYPAEKIPELIENCHCCDMVVGARTADIIHIPFSRRPVKWILSRLSNYLAGSKIPDLNSGMRIFRKDIAERFVHILPSGFSFTATLTLAMLCNDYRVHYIPINYHRRVGESKIRPIPDTMNFFQLVMRTALYFKPLKIFLPLGCLLMLAALGVLFYSYYFLAMVMDVTVIVIFMAAVQVFTIGLLADLIDKRLQQ